MSYNLNGNFYEACDCEVICSCWAGVDPEMGQCTGLWAWNITSGAVNGQDISNTRVMILSKGKSCDDADYMLLLIDDGTAGGNDATKQSAIALALQSGPWGQVIDTTGLMLSETRSAKIDFVLDAGSKFIGVKATAIGGLSITVIANSQFPPQVATAHVSKAYLIDDMSSGLVSRVSGSAPAPQRVEVGRIVRRTSSNDGLNLLADISTAPGYTFDLDITGTTAMRGSFEYVLA